MLDINNSKKQIYKYFFISVFFLIFGLIYEVFSHGVISYYMVFAFAIPLVLGCISYLIIYMKNVNKYFSKFGMTIFNCSIITLTFGSVIKGVLEIYGTTNGLTVFYSSVGIILIIISIVINVFYNILNDKLG